MRVVYRFEFQKASYLHESFNMCIHLPRFLLDQQDQFSQSFAVSDYSNIGQEEACFLQRGKKFYST